MKKDKLEKQSDVNVIENDTNEEKFIDKCNSSINFFDKKMMAGCAFSAVVAVASVFIIMKIGMNYHEEKIQELTENYASIDTRVKGLSESISVLNSSIESIKADFKEGKESSSYIYTSIASLQKDLSNIKKDLHIKADDIEDSVKKLPSEKISFIESFENLVKDGAPFDSFLDSYSEKIDMKKYASSNEILKFKKSNTKSEASLKKDFESVGASVFEKSFDESFWEKQKRVIKEKIVNAVKIRKTDEKAEAIDESLDDKSLFEKASEFIADGEFEKSLAALEKIKMEHKDLSSLISDVKKRVELDRNFEEFKKEFIGAETIKNG